MDEQKEVAALVGRIELSLNWIQGRIKNVKEGSPFMNESFDIHVEAQSIADDVKKLRSLIKAHREEELEKEKGPKKHPESKLITNW